MGKFIYIHCNTQSDWKSTQKSISQILGESDDQYIQSSSNELIWIKGASGIQIDQYSIATGGLQNKQIDTLEYFSFKLLVNQNEVRLISDECASRTVWYIQHNKQLIVSSSQRIIIALLGSYERNPQAISWMLATGCLGPNNAWDKRIKHLLPSSQIIYNKQKFTIKEKTQIHKTENLKGKLSEVFDDVFDMLPKYDSNTGLTLSGGYDSRAVLFNLLKKNKNINTYTWGVKSSNKVLRSDAQVAQDLAKALDVPFKYLTLDQTNISGEEIMNAYLLNGEGRLDHLNAFSDGLQIWKKLSEENINTIIRSDEAFGWIKSSSDKDVRISLDLNTTSDYKNLNDLFAKSNLQKPKWSDGLARDSSESFAIYRDRLYRQYRIPYILSALQDLMLTYVEIINPLLHPYFLKWSSYQKDSDRSDKKKYKLYVKDLLPKIPFALTPSIPEPEDLINSEKFRKVIHSKLNSDNAKNILGLELITKLLAEYKGVTSPSLESSSKRKIKNLLPYRIKKILRNSIMPYNLPHNRLVLRAYIIVKMDEIIMNDINLKK